MSRFYSLISRFIPKDYINWYIGRTNANLYYSQNGEDIVLDRYFEETPKGFFVDIGAHHPTRFSNTYRFYLKGWRGINIDATPGSMAPFKNLRPEDINIEGGISEEPGTLSYYTYHEGALNTFSKERADFLENETPYKLKAVVDVKTMNLPQLFDQYLPKGQKVDFLTIDVEGLDLSILKTNDWSRYRPEVLLVEDVLNFDNNSIESEIHSFLTGIRYELFSKTGNTLFYRDSQVKRK